jgi:hypothetical protein
MKSEKWKHIRQYENYSGNDFTNYELETNRKVRNLILYSSYLLLRPKKVGYQISVNLLSFLDTIPADSLKIYFILLFSFSKCPLFLIKVDFDWDFALN